MRYIRQSENLIVARVCICDLSERQLNEIFKYNRPLNTPPGTPHLISQATMAGDCRYVIHRYQRRIFSRLLRGYHFVERM
jgi:hypothetical protein